MRAPLLMSLLLLSPGLASASPPQCAVSTAAADPPPAIAAPPAPVATVPSTMPLRITAEQIARVPALQRIASNAAELFDLGAEHGLQSVFARHGNTFQVFFIAPDGQAVIGGVMWSASGKNLTRERVAQIEGTIPTVTVIGSPAAQPATSNHVGQAIQAAKPPLTSSNSSALKVVEATAFGTIGNPGAPRLWVFVDPLCSFSVQAMHQLRPYVTAGRVRLSVIPLSLLDHEDQGRSTSAAKAMLSLSPEAMVEAWASNKLAGSADPAADARLTSNMAAADAISLRGTPTFVWRRADGSEGRSDGLPDRLDILIASLGS